VCKYLISGCAVDANLMTFDGDSAFMLAAWQGHLTVCKWLVTHARADPHQINKWGCNAVFKAARMDGAHSSMEMFKYVVGELQVDSQLINGNGHSVLHKAAIYGRKDVVRYLLDNQYCCRTEHVMPDRERQTPSEMARYNGFSELAGVLRHHEDVLWCVPVMWQEPLDLTQASERAKAEEEEEEEEEENEE
jgi:ankyrin repeat protein